MHDMSCSYRLVKAAFRCYSTLGGEQESGLQAVLELGNQKSFLRSVSSCSQMESRLRFRRMERNKQLLDLLNFFDSDYHAWR